MKPLKGLISSVTFFKSVSFGFLLFMSLTARAQELVMDKEAMAKMYSDAEKINARYLKVVKPIFQMKCFDCHSSQTHFPWYHSLPIVKTMLDKDITDGMKHLDMSDDFPFAGHGSAEEDLKAIKSAVNKNAMPPFKYWVIHWNSRLSDSDKEVINKWVDESIQIIEIK